MSCAHSRARTTHAADYGNHIALSKEWVEFANPTISEIRSRHDKAPNDEDCLNKEIRTAGTWPSVYGCESLTEALAEYVAAYVWDRDFAIKDKFKTAIAPRILLPSESDQEWSRHFRKGDRAFRSKDYDTAITEFNIVAGLDPGAPIPHQYACFCYSFQGKFDEALNESGKALALFDSLGVKPTDPYRINIVKLRGTVLGHTGKFAEAKAMWDELLQVDPSNREAIKQRSICYANIGELEKSRQDSIELARLNKLEDERQQRSALYRPADVKALRMEVNSFMQGTSPILRGWDAESFDINSE
jgi:tetratricopeptide (TPR) repeat protein